MRTKSIARSELNSMITAFIEQGGKVARVPSRRSPTKKKQEPSMSREEMAKHLPKSLLVKLK